MSREDPRWLAVGGLVIGGALLLTFGLMWWIARRRASLSARMQSTDGTLFEIGTRKRASGSNAYWTIEARYAYSVGGVAYSGTRARLAFNSYRSEAKAVEAIGGRNAGDHVRVWYDPGSPASSALGRDAPRAVALYQAGTVAGAILAIVSGYALL